MKAQTSTYDLVAASSLGDVLARLRDEPGVYKLFAGGTDLMVVFAIGKLDTKRLIDIAALDELRGIVESDDAFVLGALTTFSEIQDHAQLSAEFPMLRKAASEVGGWAIQNRATIGGNIVNASPAADSPPALLAYDADIALASARGERWIPYSTFHLGYKKTLLAGDELITKVRLPRVPAERRRALYRKVGPRKAQAISKVCFAGRIDFADDVATTVRIALGGVAPIVVRCKGAEAALEGTRLTPADVDAAALALAKDIAPIDDVRSNARYRRRVAENILRAFATS